LAVFVKDIKMAKKLAEISHGQEQILKKYWPGKYTFVLKSKFQNPNFKANSKFKIQITKLCIGKNGTIALRIPKHKFLNDLLNKINKPLAQTSVNISGKPPLTKISDIKEFITGSGLAILIIDAGNLPKRKASVIMDLTKDEIKFLRK